MTAFITPKVAAVSIVSSDPTPTLFLLTVSWEFLHYRTGAKFVRCLPEEVHLPRFPRG
jgi:hypothetical protein